MALDREFQRREARVAREAHYLQQTAGIDRRKALLAWRAAAAKLLGETFNHWAKDPSRRTRQIGQCIGELEVMAEQLHDRGWLLSHDRLVDLARQAVAPVATAQAAGKIGDFWPYYRAAVRRFVPVNADEIQREARKAGADSTRAAGDLMAALAGVVSSNKASPVEAIGARHAEAAQEACKPAARRGRPPKFKAAAEATGDLFGGDRGRVVLKPLANGQVRPKKWPNLGTRA